MVNAIRAATAKRWGQRTRRSFTEAQFAELVERVATDAIADVLDARLAELREFVLREGAARAVLALLDANGLDEEVGEIVRGWRNQYARTRILQTLRVGHIDIVPPARHEDWP